MIFRGNANEFLQLETIDSKSHPVFNESLENGLTILWNISENACLAIDGVDYTLPKNQLIFLTEFHQIKAKKINKLRLLSFNRPFYCIIDHDSEVSCKGILFFGTSNVPFIELPTSEFGKFEILWTMFHMEMESKDNLQMEMLQVLLKRLLIMCTRLYKEQKNLVTVLNKRLDVIREFYYLVEKHFKEHRDVAFYASRLHKSPKTLSNLFGELDKSPLQIIQERILLEARRQLHYTDKAIKEITYELGYEDIQSFSRFFKSKEKHSPAKYRIISRDNKIREELPTHWENLPTHIQTFQDNFAG